jgi:hypothetical protein
VGSNPWSTAGWKCCKPRVLTFDEFLSIPPCTEGRHSTTDLPPQIEKKEVPAETAAAAAAGSPPPARVPVSSRPQQPTPTPATPPPAVAPDSDSDDPALEIPDGRICRRKGCGAVYRAGQRARAEGSDEKKDDDDDDDDDEKCVFHPGFPIFHEGSKGYSCCKRRVLEFDQFLKLEGCETKKRHLFVGSGKKDASGRRRQVVAGADGAAGGEGEEVEEVESVRQDFYQTASAVIASFFLKKINKETAKVAFRPQEIVLDLRTTDTPSKHYQATVPLYATIDADKSKYNILGTKLEVTLAKADGTSWPVLRSDDRVTGEIYQVGRAGRA